MNKRIASAVSITLFCVSTAIYADGCSSFFGSTSCSNTTVPSLQAKSNAKIDKTTIQNDATVGGNFSATASGVGTLQVKGNAELMNTTVFGNAVIGGDFRANNSSIASLNIQGKTALTNSNVQKPSTFTGDFMAQASNLTSATMYSSKVSLNKASASNITMKTADAVVCLDHSKIGRLNFTQGGGSVYKDSNSRVPSLSGGKIVAGNCPFTATA